MKHWNPWPDVLFPEVWSPPTLYVPACRASEDPEVFNVTYAEFHGSKRVSGECVWWYCWWFKNPAKKTTWDVKNHVVSRVSEASTVGIESILLSHLWHLQDVFKCSTGNRPKKRCWWHPINAGKIHADTHLDPPFGCQISDSWRIQAHTLSDIMRPPPTLASPRLNINSSVLRKNWALATEVSLLRQRSHDNLRFPMAPWKAAFFFCLFRHVSNGWSSNTTTKFKEKHQQIWREKKTTQICCWKSLWLIFREFLLKARYLYGLVGEVSCCSSRSWHRAFGVDDVATCSHGLC